MSFIPIGGDHFSGIYRSDIETVRRLNYLGSGLKDSDNEDVSEKTSDNIHNRVSKIID